MHSEKNQQRGDRRCVTIHQRCVHRPVPHVALLYRFGYRIYIEFHASVEDLVTGCLDHSPRSAYILMNA